MTDPRYIASILLAALLSGCASQIDPATVKKHQLEVQSMQTATFDTNDRKAVVRAVIAALQDLYFVINNVDIRQGIVTAKKFGDYPIEMTITVQLISNKQILLHGIAQYKLTTIEDPVIYEQFFSSVQKSLPVTSRSGI